MSFSGWNKDQIIKFSIGHEYVDSDLTNFPVLLNLSVASGRNNYDCTDVFDELTTGSGNDSHTKLLVQSDDANGSTTFTDLSASTHTLTPTGQTNHSTAQKKFGASSIYFDGTNDYITIPSSTDFDFGTGDFTLDCWCRPDAGALRGANRMIARGSVDYGSDGQWCWGIGDTWRGGVKFNVAYRHSGGRVTDCLSNALTISANNWYHFALVRRSGILYFYLNGVQQGSASASHSLSVASTQLYIGCRDTGSGHTPGHENIEGYLDEIRISKGIARWTSNFTPPTNPYVAVANKKIAVVYPALQEHYVTISGVPTLVTYNHGSTDEMYCEIERWDTSSKSAQLWVRVPRVLSNQPTDVLLYYDSTQEDNTSYVGDTGSTPAKAVWDSDFVAVYHMAQNPSQGANSILDSTVNNNHGTPNGSMTSGDLVAGQVGKAIDFDGIDDWIEINDVAAGVAGNNVITVEQNVKTTQLGSDHNSCLFTFNSSGYGDKLRICNDSHITIHDATTTGTLDGTAVVNDGNWHYSVVHTHATQDDYVIITDTNVEASGITPSNFASNDLVSIGQEFDTGAVSSDFFQGILDEIRVSKIVRSYEWIKATYYSNADAVCNISEADIYRIDGYVKESGSPVERMVYLYDRYSGELMDKVISNSLGYYMLRTTTSGLHNLVCLDDPAAPVFNDLLISKVVPTEEV